MTSLRHRRGYTLIELMMVVAIVGILASIGPMLMTQLQNFFFLTTARNEIERDARVGLDTMNRFIRQAVDGTILIDTPASGGGPYSRIRFKTVDGRYVEFHQNGDELVEIVNGDTSIMSRDLAYLAFTFPRTDSPTIVSVSLSMSKAIQLGNKKVLELTIENVRVMN